MMRDGTAPDSAILDLMGGAMAHRGPDGIGIHLSGPVGLVHTRLAIIDLETGDQPLFGPGPAESRLTLVANGEIYNDPDLRQDLADVSFVTRSDCEPPLHLYARHGTDYARYLRGMYAIALHDPAENLLLLSRDPFGIKPLYVAETSEALLFASEPRALIASGLVNDSLDKAKLREHLQLQFTTGRQTPWTTIQRVAPGETLVIREGRVIDRHQRDSLPLTPPRRDREKADLLAELDRLFEDSVRVHQRSDVPYGMFLSGGIDSSAVLAMMARLNDRPVRAYTAYFPGTNARDERDSAKKAVVATGAEAVEVPFGEDDFWVLLPRVVEALDDPVADYAILPTFKLAAAARDDGIKVVLSGEGGDELFGGYGRYRAACRPWPLAKKMRRAGILDKLNVLHEAEGWRDGLTADEVLLRQRAPEYDCLQRAQAADVAGWLPNDLLIKLDRCLMAHGVEGRVPFLDPALAEFAFRLPPGMKARDGRGKWLLRQWLADHLPSSEPFAAKRGFTVPVGEWIAAEAGRLADPVAAQPGIAQLCDPGNVRALFKAADPRQGKALWTLLFFALWHQRHVLGIESGGDVWESLSSA
ncbi:Putative asparagine synthase [Magnetospira sp. QH-2]|nr:Putative asparagine synthase [Magnetospira sp. QH-2]